MHSTNFTIYHLLRYQIELDEAMEYSLPTYKLDETELSIRLKYLHDDYKNGFFKTITSHLFKNSKELTKEIKYFNSKYSKHRIIKMIESDNLQERIIYNRDLYSAFTASYDILKMLLEEETIKANLEKDLTKLIEINERHFNMGYLFSSLNQYLSSKYELLPNKNITNLDFESKELMLALLSSITIESQSLYNDALDIINEKKVLDEEASYEILNKISMEYTKIESSLYQNFENFSKKLEKEIEKASN